MLERRAERQIDQSETDRRNRSGSASGTTEAGPRRHEADHRASLRLSVVLGMAAFMGGGLLPMAWAEDAIFVTNNNFGSGAAVRVYNRTATGDVAPIRTLQGSTTGLSVPSGVAVDTMHDELLVANRFMFPSITVYPRSASGNTAPSRTIIGAATGLGSPRGLAVDTVHDELVVTDEVSNKILVFPLTASGNTAPSRTITGAATGLSTPWGIVGDTVHDELVVADEQINSITVYARTANGDAAPIRTLQGPATGLTAPRGVAVDLKNDELVVANQINNSITVYARTANGNTAPKRTLSGLATGLNGPIGLAVDLANNELVVSNMTNNSITVYSRAASGNSPPLRTLMGPTTQLGAATGESIFLAVTTDTPDPSLLQVTIQGDGTGMVTSDPPGIECSTGNTGTCGATFKTGSSVTLTARTTGTSGFGGWGGDCAGSSSSCLVTMATPKNVTAAFVAHTLTITGPSGSPNPVASGGTVTLSVTASDSLNHPLGYAWSASCLTLGSNGSFNNPTAQTPTWTAPTNTTGSEQTCTIQVTVSDGQGLSQVGSYSQRVSSAAFAAVALLSSGTGIVTSSPAGINCGSGSPNTGTCTASFPSGTGVILTGAPTGGSTFGGWGGACATVGTALTCTLSMNGPKSVTATFTSPPPTMSPTASVALNGTAFLAGQTLAYQATLTPASTPIQVDIYLGALLPDGKTFLSLVQVSPGVISFVLGPSPTPFLANVTLTQTVVPFSYTFQGVEPGGTYFTYAGLAIAGSDPFRPPNQLSLAIQPFQFTP